MSLKIKSLFCGAAVLAATATPALAAPDQCTIVPSGSATYNAQIAVASNFFDAAQAFVANYFTAPGAPGAGTYINICQNSTASLLSEITTGTSGFSLFLAADPQAPDSLVGTPYVQSGATSKLYAKGVPVLFALSGTVDNVQTLIPAVASGVAATLSSVVTSTDALNPTNAATVAVADPMQAPYGFRAQEIIQDMGFTWNPPTSPSWVANPLYANIDLTFKSVTAGSPPPNKSGFVSKGQICSGIGMPDPAYVYIEFTNAKYTLRQKGIAISSGDPTQDALGAALFSYMLSDLTFWNAFLEESCYGQITGSRLFKHTGLFVHHRMPVRTKKRK